MQTEIAQTIFEKVLGLSVINLSIFFPTHAAGF